jgi:transcriptional regulator with XRE-family HTH domain
MHGVSGTALAGAVGISRGYLSRVENGRQVPSLVILDAIAQKFGIELGYFFNESSTGQIAISPAVDRTENEFPPATTFAYEALCTRRSQKLAQPFLAFFLPRTRTRVAAHNAEYFRYVVAGRLALHYEGERYDLASGDAIYYDAFSAHEIECVSQAPARVITLFIKPAALAVPTAQPVTIEGHSMPSVAPDEIRAALLGLGLDPNGVDLDWIVRVKQDTEQRIAEYRKDAEFAAVVAVSALPPPD